MTELAIEVLPWFGLSASEGTDDSTQARIKFAIESEPIIKRGDEDTWAYGSDQARLELLVDRFYANPPIVQKAARIIGSYPTFINDLAAEIRKREEVSKDARLRRPKDPEREQLNILKDELLGNPKRVFEEAVKFDFALPFAMVLHYELEEIGASRDLRKAPDDEANLTTYREELEAVSQALDAATDSSSPRMQFRSRITALQKRKAELELRLTYLMEAQEKERRPRDTTVEQDVEQSGPGAQTQPFRHSLRQALEQDLFGVALSGGGIRSATFNLGILQALAEMDLLRKVDYLSTVSGGGYIGSWLATWSKRLEPDGIRKAQQFLSPVRSPDPEARDVRPIRHLREYSNHITPNPGFLSADTWTMVMVWLRNTLLNQTVLVLFLGGILLLPHGLLTLFFEGSSRWAFAAATALLLAASWSIGSNLRSFTSKGDNTSGRGGSPSPAVQPSGDGIDWTQPRWVLALILAPLFVGAVLYSRVLVDWMNGPDSPGIFGLNTRARAATASFLILFVAQLVVHARGRNYLCFNEQDKRADGSTPKWAFVVLPFVSLLTSALGGWLVWLLAPTGIWGSASTGESKQWWGIIFGPPATIYILSTVIVAQIGLLGRNFPDERREWWARLAAFFSMFILGWLALFAISVYGPLVLIEVKARYISAATFTWIGSTILGVVVAKSAKTAGPVALPGVKKGRMRELISLVTPYIFIAGLLVAIASGVYLLLARHYCNTIECPYWSVVAPSKHWYALIMATTAFLGSWLLARRVGVNEFSMHHFYRNRLVRTYLGASRKEIRRPNKLTDFDPKDDEPLSQMTTAAYSPYIGPYPILNSALNFVKSDDLSHQERKAQSFAFTPLYCGYEFIDRKGQDGHPPRLCSDGYRPTKNYASPSADGICIGTAMAISGAAVNPNMGFHSSPATAFLLTMFNVRLGWWLGNPRHASTWKATSPPFGFLYLLAELIGQTDDHSRFVNLSDGGHFDNLGVYELIRRRCRYIVVCDVEQDADLKFSSLGAVVRKCRTDFGIDINIRLDAIQRSDPTAYSRVHCVVGDITYPDGHHGKLLYIKSSLTGDEPADVREYHSRQPLFPQQSTADQFFDESQFESYRALGYHIAQNTFRRAVDAHGSEKPANLFSYLENLWFPPAPSVQSFTAKHVAAYEAILERVRADQDLMKFDEVLFPGLPDYLKNAASPTKRDAFYTSTMMMDFMQTVFIDLDLEENSAHPHNAGWLQIFHQWASRQVFKDAWGIAKETYGERFRRFCEAKLQLPY